MRLSKDSNLPLVSVCIQTFQHRDYIVECLESVLCQRVNFGLEIIIGEDESSDGTREVCLEYARNYPNFIRLFLRKRSDVIYVGNKPTGRYNMIENIRAARGKYIALLEGDDYWVDPDKLQKQVDFLEINRECVVCHHWQKIAERDKSGIYAIKDAPTVGHGYFPEEKATVKEIFLNQLRIKSRTIMFRNVLKDFPDWFYKVAYGDVPLSMILGKYGDFGFINQPMAVYRQTGKGVSSHGKECSLFTFNQYIEWVKIWEYGDRHYNGEHLRKVLQTIYYFYDVILKRYKYSRKIWWMIIGYVLFSSRLSLLRRLQVFFEVSKKVMRSRFRSLQSKNGSTCW